MPPRGFKHWLELLKQIDVLHMECAASLLPKIIARFLSKIFIF